MRVWVLMTVRGVRGFQAQLPYDLRTGLAVVAFPALEVLLDYVEHSFGFPVPAPPHPCYSSR